jgi:hypothetical protein
MERRWYKGVLFLVFLLVGCAALASFLFQPVCSGGDVVRIPVSFFPFPDSPFIKMSIEGKRYRLLLDTGSSHELDLHARVLGQLQEKEFLWTSQYIDLRGSRYPVSRFQIPSMTIHKNLGLHGVIVYEESIPFLTKDTKTFLGRIKKQIALRWIDGRLGWPVFEQTACLFDFPHDALILAKNMEALQGAGVFHPSHFIKIPLAFSRCGPVLSVQTEWGESKFLLDTGASHSAYRDLELQSSPGEVLTLWAQQQSLGKQRLYPYPISPDLAGEFDGVLGVDFFQSHVICFDSQEKYIYIKNIEKGGSP